MEKFRWALVFALILIIPCVAFAAPGLINYQGKLANSSGNPYNGDASITFTIYNAPAGGDVLWTETQTVTVTGGVFNVLLGSQTPILANTFDGDDRYLGVKVDTDAEMTPRQQLASVPYAMKAAAVDGRDMAKPTAPSITAVNALWDSASSKPAMQIYGTESTDSEGIFTYLLLRNGVPVLTGGNTCASDYSPPDGIPDDYSPVTHFASGVCPEGYARLGSVISYSPNVIDGNLDELSTYCYQLSAVNWAFNRSDKSNEVCAQTGGFIDNGDGTISQVGAFIGDRMWQQTDDGNTYNWYQANGIYNATYNPTSVDPCGNLTLAGYDDWRLSSTDDMYILMDMNFSPTIRPIFNVRSAIYWTSLDGGGNYGGYADFNTGSRSCCGSSNIKSNTYYVRCVRDIIE